jgi:hypothetical protein
MDTPTICGDRISETAAILAEFHLALFVHAAGYQLEVH